MNAQRRNSHQHFSVLLAEPATSGHRSFNGRWRPFCLWLAFALAASAFGADELVFHDEFRNHLDAGWTWRHEHPQAWRLANGGLEVRIEPGNIWGTPNSAKNMLLRNAPDASTHQITVSVQVENSPTNQYEQADLVWYYDDGDMVKIGHELVDGSLSIVMGRQEYGKTHTIAIIPVAPGAVQLRQIIKGNHIRGQYRPPGSQQWQDAGECDLPAHGQANISLQCYQGPRGAEHWARFTDFQIRCLDCN